MSIKHLLLVFLIVISGWSGIGQTLPVDMTDLLVWYDANDNNIAPGQISVWPDLSGNGYDLIQGNATNRPIKVDNALGGKSVIRFNGNNFMRVDFGENKSNAGTIFVVYNVIGSTGQYIMDGTNTFTSIISRTPANDDLISFFSINSNNSLDYQRSRPFDHIINTIVVNGNNSRIRENGIVMDSKNINSTNITGLFVGQHRSNILRLEGDLAELIYFNRPLSDNEIQTVEDYLSYKYGRVDLGADIEDYGFCNDTIVLKTNENFTSYTWSDGSTADSLLINKPGTYWVEAENKFGWIFRDTLKVSYPFQYPDINKYKFCPGENIDITWQPKLGADYYTYEWSNGSIADSIVINTTGSYYAKITDTLGCSMYSDTLNIIDDPFSSTAALGADTNLCKGNKISLFIGDDEAESYLWSTGEITSEITINNTGEYSLEVQNENGCIAQDTIFVTVIGDAPVLFPDVPSYVCVNTPFNFNDQSITTDGSVVNSWSWDFGDSSAINTNQQGNHIYTNVGNYNVSYSVGTSEGCFLDSTFTIGIKPKPILTFFSTSDCQNDEIIFNGGQLSSTNINDWSWIFGDTNSGANNFANGQNVSHVFAADGNYNVMLIGTDSFGCVDTLTKIKNISPVPNVDFAYTEVCEGGVVTFQNTTTTIDTSTISSYKWTFGDGNTSHQINPQKPFTTHGTYNVTLTATSSLGCTSEKNQPVKIHAFPKVFSKIEQACAGISTVFSDKSFIPEGSVAKVNWSIDGKPAITGFTIENIFNTSGVHSLRQTVESAFGCSNTKDTVFEIRALINATFELNPQALIADYPIIFESLSEGAEEYNWTFGDFAQSNKADTVIIFDSTQIGDTINIQLIISNSFGCSDTAKYQSIVRDRTTDLQLSNLYSQVNNGFLIVGVELKNNGTTPITAVDLFFRKPDIGVIKETWEGLLQAGESEIYVLSTSPNASVSAQDSNQNYICMEGRIAAPTEFIETVFTNNEVCNVISKNQTAIVKPYPNPITDNEMILKIIEFEDAVADIEFIDDKGRLIDKFSELELNKGLNELKINVVNWSSGTYIIRYISKENIIVRKIIKL